MPNVVRPASREALRCGEALAHEGAAGRRAYIWRRKGCVGAACAPLALLAWRATTGGSSVGLSVCGAVYGTVGLRSLLGPRTTLRLYSRVLPVFGLAGNRSGYLTGRCASLVEARLVRRTVSRVSPAILHPSGGAPRSRRWGADPSSGCPSTPCSGRRGWPSCGRCAPPPACPPAR